MKQKLDLTPFNELKDFKEYLKHKGNNLDITRQRIYSKQELKIVKRESQSERKESISDIVDNVRERIYSK